MLSVWNGGNPTSDSATKENEQEINDGQEDVSKVEIEDVYSDASEQNEDSCSTSTSDSDDSEKDGAIVLSQNVNGTSPEFGNICVKNSTDIHFGNKTFYQGPVTIKQFVYANPCLEGVEETDEEVATKLAIKCSEIVIPNGNLKEQTVVNGNGVAKTKEDSVQNGASNGVQKSTEWVKNWSTRRNLWIISFSITITITIVVVAGVLLTRKPSQGVAPIPVKPEGVEQDIVSVPVDSPVDPDNGLHLSGKLMIVPRKQWLAQPPQQPSDVLKHPVPYVVIWHTATENCTNQAECVYHVRFIQTFHMESRHWWDIAYNFLIGGDGLAYEGRGWDAVGSHTFGYNNRSIGIAFVGTFNNYLPSDSMFLACEQLIQKGIEDKVIAPDYKLLAARQLTATQAPGGKLYERLKTWKHWAPKP